MDQEPYTQYNNGSVGNVFRISTQHAGNISPRIRQAAGTIPRHWIFQSGAKQREGRQTEGRILYHGNTREDERSCMLREGFLMDWQGSHMLPQNMTPWQMEYLKLKQFWETAHAGRTLWPSPMKLDTCASCERCPLCIWRKGASSSPRWKDAARNRMNRPC